jgi:hypothetical protein
VTPFVEPVPTADSASTHAPGLPADVCPRCSMCLLHRDSLLAYAGARPEELLLQRKRSAPSSDAEEGEGGGAGCRGACSQGGCGGRQKRRRGGEDGGAAAGGGPKLPAAGPGPRDSASGRLEQEGTCQQTEGRPPLPGGLDVQALATAMAAFVAAALDQQNRN